MGARSTGFVLWLLIPTTVPFTVNVVHRRGVSLHSHKEKDPPRSVKQLNSMIAKKATTPEEIFDICDRRTLSDVNYATALTWFAKRRRGPLTPRACQRGAALVRRVTQRLKEEPVWGARALANAAWGSAKVLSYDDNEALSEALKECLRTIAEKAVSEISCFKSQELSNLAWALATAGVSHWRVMDEIANKATQIINELRPQELSILIWSFGKLHVPNSRALFDAITTEAKGRFSDFKPQELSNTVWAVATTGYDAGSDFWDRAANEMIHHFESDLRRGPVAYATRTQHIANFLWAAAKAQPSIALDRLFDVGGRLMIARINEAKTQEMGNVVWAFATAKIEGCPEVFDRIADAATPLLPRFVAQNMANMVWAFATANHRNDALFLAIAAEAAERADEFNPQELANALWAFPTAGVAYPRPFLDAFVNASIAKISGFTEQGLANVGWALSTSGVAGDYPEYFSALETEVLPRLPSFSHQALANIPWSYANAEIASSRLFNAVAHEIVNGTMITEFQPQEFTNLAWAFARNGHHVPEVYDALAQAVLAHAARHGNDLLRGNLGAQELANVAWAYACADHVDPGLLSLLWRAIVELAQKSKSDRYWGFGESEMRQLQQVVLHLRYEAKGVRAANVAEISRAPPAFLMDLKTTLKDYDARLSWSQQQIARTVRNLGLPVDEEFVTADGLSIDVVILPHSRRIGIEFDGPWHYYTNQPRTPTGRTLFKMRLLKASGWHVLHIPYWEWNDLGDDDASREGYIKTRLINVVRDRNNRSDDDTAQSPTTTTCTADLRDAYAALRVTELRELCDKRGINRTVRRSEGSPRAVLEARLREYDAHQKPTVDVSDPLTAALD